MSYSVGILRKDANSVPEVRSPTVRRRELGALLRALRLEKGLTVEQAASKQGLTVAQFRALENKIEGDDTLRERVRKALRHAANPKDTDSSDD